MMSTNNSIDTGLSGQSGSGKFTGNNNPSIVTGFLDENGNMWILQNAVPSAVNGLEFTNAPMGQHPAIAAYGSDTDINLLLAAKGNASVFLVSGGAPVLSAAELAPSSVNYFNMYSNTTGNGPILQVLGADTNIPLNIEGKGTSGVNLRGTGTNDNAPSGYVGEYETAQLPFASAASFSTGTPRDIITLSLGAGDWDVSGNLLVTYTVSSTGTAGWISTTSATMPDQSLVSGPLVLAPATIASFGYSVFPVRISLATPTTVYLSAVSSFGSGASSGCGTISARRVR